MVTVDDLRQIFGAGCAPRSSGAHPRSKSHNGNSIESNSDVRSRRSDRRKREKGRTSGTSREREQSLYRIKIYEHELSFDFIPDRYEPKKSPKKANEKIFPEEDAAEEEKNVPPVRKEGDITTFSKKSRFRLFRLFNRVHVSRLSDALFLSLTASPEAINSDDFQYAFRKSFVPRLKKILPNACWIWRLEPHRSGKPHYHLLLWSHNVQKNMQSEYWKRKIRKAWRLTIEDYSRAAELYSCKIRDVDSFQKARSYMSQYLAKEDKGRSLVVTGRRWGRTKNLPVDPIADIWLNNSEREYLEILAKSILRGQSRDSSRSIERIESYDSWFLWLELGTISWIMERLHFHDVVDHLDLHVLPQKTGTNMVLPKKNSEKNSSESLDSKVEYALSIKEEYEELAGHAL